MNVEEIKEIHRRSAAHRAAPEPGDYWHEMFNPVCVVLEVGHFSIAICRKIQHPDSEHWTWDLSKIESMPLRDWQRWIGYESMPEKTWCEVSDRKHDWAVEAAKASEHDADGIP